ncbi:MAG: aspartyl/glutamyl-tRNA(Asn/Gln) amidotransferase subunit B [Candidatus Tyloplasma litorale]|nr:MAG: aspartyl/glutamyl-tRNA(Asn/Gln) amidotransferase subunit B [Mycoplasmatales bacterium]
MKKWIPAFGVEIHAELLTKTKAFSPSEVNFDSKPNTNVSPIDMGYPGAKPTVNKKMIEYAYRLAKIFKMEIEEKIIFDRKNYFYPDLPKGFQITQYFKPIGKNGKFKIFVNDYSKDITITEIHMEEDTAKQIKTDEGTLFDFNRAGIPLIEIVSDHKELSSIEEVIEYVKQIREQLIILGINDGKMENGSFRVDVNVSIRDSEKMDYGIRTEIKNLNSFKNIERALYLEINRHIKEYSLGNIVKSTTVKFDEDKNMTIPMREKDNQYDYNFIPEGNINPIILTTNLKEEFDKNSEKDISIFEFRNTWKDKINKTNLSIITSKKIYFDIFQNLFKKINFDELVNFIVNNVKNSINNSKLKKNRINYDEILQIIKLRKEGKIDNKKANKLINDMFENNISNQLEKLGKIVMLSDTKIRNLISKLIIENKEMIDNNLETRVERIEKFLMGEVMKKTKGKASPQMISKLIREILWEE